MSVVDDGDVTAFTMSDIDARGIASVVKVNPTLNERDETASLAAELASSALGRRIP